MKKTLLTTIICLMAALGTQAKVVLPHFFDSGMVMQQNATCKLWGKATPGKKVSVTTSWNNKTYTTTADSNGQFSISVATQQAGGPYTITLNDGEKTILSDILLGEVWLCSGQSNMEMPVKGFKAQPVSGSLDVQLSGEDPEMRLFSVKRNTALQPADDVVGQWSHADAANVRNFSATAYFFGRTLRRMLGVPVGLVVVAYGGSACEAWMNPDWLDSFPTIDAHPSEAWMKKKLQRCPTSLYYGMLHPLIGMKMRGVIWYQGEENVNRWQNYCRLFTRMVKGWRDEWQNGNFPFYYCQIAPYDYTLVHNPENSAYLREQQRLAENPKDSMWMAVLLDAGLEYGIHPRKKLEAGQRLALQALRNTYGVKSLPDYARFSTVTVSGDTACVAFDTSKEWVYFEHGKQEGLYEVQAPDSTWHEAKAWINRNRLYLRSDEVKHPVNVRYGFRNYVVADLMHDGLPVSSFTSEKIKEQ